MVDSLTMALIGASLGVTAQAVALGYLRALPTAPAGLGWWTSAFALVAASPLLTVLAPTLGPAVVGAGGDAVGVAAAALVLRGCCEFLGRRWSPRLTVLAIGAAAVWAGVTVAVAGSPAPPPTEAALPAVLAAALLAVAGIDFLLGRPGGTARSGYEIVGVALILWSTCHLLGPVANGLVPGSDGWRALAAQGLAMTTAVGVLVTVLRRLQLRAEASEHHAREIAIRDDLTGLYNRRHFFARGEEEAGRARRYGSPLSVVLFDVDHFKQVNDTHGHTAGDAVLKALAVATGSHVRDSDVLARFGGEEFIVLLPETGGDEAARAAERLRLAIARLAVTCPAGALVAPGSGGVVRPTISLGVATAERGADLQALVARADAAMYAAKRGGRNRVVVADAPVAHLHLVGQAG